MAKILITCTPELVNGRFMMEVLERAGYEVVIVDPKAGSLQPALAIEQPDLVILDMMHPDIDLAISHYDSRPINPPYWLFVTKVCFPEVPVLVPPIRERELLNLVRIILEPPEAEEEKVFEI